MEKNCLCVKLRHLFLRFVMSIESDVRAAKQDITETFNTNDIKDKLNKSHVIKEEVLKPHNKLETSVPLNDAYSEVVEDKVTLINRKLSLSQNMGFYNVDVDKVKRKKGINNKNFHLMYR